MAAGRNDAVTEYVPAGKPAVGTVAFPLLSVLTTMVFVNPVLENTYETDCPATGCWVSVLPATTGAVTFTPTLEASGVRLAEALATVNDVTTEEANNVALPA